MVKVLVFGLTLRDAVGAHEIELDVPRDDDGQENDRCASDQLGAVDAIHAAA